MSKKLRKILAVAIVCVVALCGCGNGASQTNQSTFETVKETMAVESEPEITESVTTESNEKSVTESSEAAKLDTVEESQEEEANYDVIPEKYTYSLTVSINPLVELYFDAENVIVGVAYLNQDAVDAYLDTELLGTSLEDGLDILVNAAVDKGYLKEDAAVEIELAKISEESVEGFDNTILLEASNRMNEVLESISTEKEIHLENTVEVKVSTEVEETTGVKAPVVCSECNGTGNSCKECSGTGIVNCKRCVNGVESCGTCHGTAIINCHGCKGAGGDCNHCDGSGKISCDACHGQGTFLCSWCKGALRHVCPDCWGEGSCSACGGDGVL